MTTESKSTRLLSLDFFRGITVAAMVLVNNPGSWAHIYPPLEHADWNGCTPTDLVFPFFLFIVGVSIVFSMDRVKKQPETHKSIVIRALKRAAILFGLGLFLSLFPKIFTHPIEALSTVRIPGVLQRIALVFFFSTLIFLKNSKRRIFIIMLSLIVLYWVLIRFVPVPGLGYPNMEKGINLGAWIDRMILGEAHLWKAVRTWDPEGLLSSIPAIASGLLGVLAGLCLRNQNLSGAEKTSWLFCYGLLSVIAGLSWGLIFPINKSMWTSSYVLYTGGLAAMGLGLCYWLIDVQGYSRFSKPFVVYGVNAITVFFLSGLLSRILQMIRVNDANGLKIPLPEAIHKTLFLPYFSPINASLASALMNVFVWMAILWVMHDRKIIIKV